MFAVEGVDQVRGDWRGGTGFEVSGSDTGSHSFAKGRCSSGQPIW